MDENIHNNIQATNRNTDILKALAYKCIDQEARSRRNNLIFWGIAENLREDCFILIRDFIQNQLDIDPDRIYLSRAHRLGVQKSNPRGQRRPIIVNFCDFRGTEVIISRTYMSRKTPFSIYYDLPKGLGGHLVSGTVCVFFQYAVSDFEIGSLWCLVLCISLKT